LAALKEDTNEVQKNMPAENFENVKLFPVLKEAYELLAELERIASHAKKEISRLEAEKLKLNDKKG